MVQQLVHAVEQRLVVDVGHALQKLDAVRLLLLAVVVRLQLELVLGEPGELLEDGDGEDEGGGGGVLGVLVLQLVVHVP